MVNDKQKLIYSRVVATNEVTSTVTVGAFQGCNVDQTRQDMAANSDPPTNNVIAQNRRSLNYSVNLLI